MTAVEPASPGEALAARVATPERARRVVAELIGSTIAFGPVPAGPSDMASAVARGTVGRLEARADAPGHVTVRVPVDLDLAVTIGTREVPVTAELEVRVGLRSAASPARDRVVVEVDPLGADDIDVVSHARGFGGVLVRRLGDLDGEIRRHVIGWVTDLLGRPEADAARRLPVPEGA